MRDIIDERSNDNSLFVTAQCNNRCLMCSQPPLKVNDIDYNYSKNLALIDSAPDGLTDLGITGGEPTLLGNKLFTLLDYIIKNLPQTCIHLLTNGRAFCDLSYTAKLSELNRENILFGVPLHSDFSGDHDYITQVQGSYNETMQGLYNLARFECNVELRIVLNKVNYRRLPKISQFIFKNLPFVKYISFMGLEFTGWSIRNADSIWIDPVEYKNELQQAVDELASWGMTVSIFNIPLCLLDSPFHQYSCKSISDWKMMFTECCNTCLMKNDCCGLFSTSKHQSRGISPFHI